MAAAKARDLAQKTFDIDSQEQQLGAGSIYQTLTAQRDLSIAESTLVTAQTGYEKAKVDLDRTTGTTLDELSISIDDSCAPKAGRYSSRKRPPCSRCSR